jgi:hypothetical protein
VLLNGEAIEDPFDGQTGANAKAVPGEPHSYTIIVPNCTALKRDIGIELTDEEAGAFCVYELCLCSSPSSSSNNTSRLMFFFSFPQVRRFVSGMSPGAGTFLVVYVSTPSTSKLKAPHPSPTHPRRLLISTPRSIE